MYQINIKTVTAPAFSEGRYSALTPRLTLVVSYTKGGVSYVTGNNIPRGYELCVQHDLIHETLGWIPSRDNTPDPFASLEATARFNATTLKRIADEVRNGKHDELIRQLYAKAKANRSQHAWPESMLPLVEEMAVKGTHNQADQHVLSKLEDPSGRLPSFFERMYGIHEESVFKKLPSSERQRIFDDNKRSWCLHYPEFKRISDLMEVYRTNELLIQYRRHCPPAFIHDKAVDVYKKCISFKVKITKKVLSPLRYHPNQSDFWCHYVAYCIDKEIVKSFLKSYQTWNLKIHNLWNEIYYLNADFFDNAGYKIRSCGVLSWWWYIEHSDCLKAKADEIQKTQEEILSLLISGIELVAKSDETISCEYRNNATEMSLYERELEVLQIGVDAADEEYCYVYVLECPLCVFYVGIAADPKDRFEQHVRGAFSDEEHLFKSRFIQKFPNRVKYDIVFEGTRRECKQFERDYICENKPLGNMTEGGEG